MPNWYTGQATLKGDVYLFRKWYIETVQQNDGNAGDTFAQTFAPLSSGKYNFVNACDEWGVKWDFKVNIISGLDEDDDEFIFTFDSAWNAPCYLWKQLETKYNVVVEEHGLEEGNRFFYKYHNGRHIVKDIDLYDEWVLNQLNFIPSKEAEEDEDIYDEELTNCSYENINNVFEHWHTTISENDDNWKEVIISDSK
jgi:hypothetical protein